MKRRLLNFWDAVLDRVYWFFIALAILALGICVLGFDLLFKKKLSALLTGHLGEKNPIESYRAWAAEHPKTAWCLQWPLLLVGM